MVVQPQGEPRLPRCRFAANGASFARAWQRARSARELWRKVNEQYSGFDEYDERTSRDIGVFVLEPR